MASLIEGYSYDIFISYRQNDNRSGWVSEFVKALQEELSATIKDSVSVYFDSDPHDALLGTHDVGDSLKGKLKCLIFIPILSQTYPDPRGFAWTHEFLSFKSLAAGDSIGLKVALSNGNVASRILPVVIHELDTSDKQLIEKELGGPVRGVEFIYKSPGVSRPLEQDEADLKANINHTFYKYQVNKVGRAVKELIGGLRQSSTGQGGYTPPELSDVSRPTMVKMAIVATSVLLVAALAYGYYYFGGFAGEEAIHERSIAVLPFSNLSDDPSQEYFTDGVAEDILNHLVKISDLKVKSRTSTLIYKGVKKSMREIGEELGVATVVEGSIRKSGNKVRVVVQLIDVKTDEHLWSESFDREIEDVFSVQSEIAIKIANALNARLTTSERDRINEKASTDITAYDFYLKARQITLSRHYATQEAKSFDEVVRLLDRAIELDPGYAEAFALKGLNWYSMYSLGRVNLNWSDSALYFSTKAIELDPALPDGYVARAGILDSRSEREASLRDFEMAYALAPSDPLVLSGYGYALLRNKDKRGAEMVIEATELRYARNDPALYLAMSFLYSQAGLSEANIETLQKAKSLDPVSTVPLVQLSFAYTRLKKYAEAIREMEAAYKINPEHDAVLDELAWAHFRKGNLDQAAKYWSTYKQIESRPSYASQHVNFRHRLGHVYILQGKVEEGYKLIKEQLRLDSITISKTTGNKGEFYYNMAVSWALLDKRDKAIQYVDSAVRAGFSFHWAYTGDPAFQAIWDEDEFKMAIASVVDAREFRAVAFGEAFNRREASNQLSTSR